MTKSKKMQPAVDVAESREKEAARFYGESQRNVLAQEKSLEQLLLYRDEYARKFEVSGERGLNMSALREYRAFLDRLNRGIDEQRNAIRLAREECEKHRLSWLEMRTRVQALGKVVDRYRSNEQKIMEKLEQRAQDEFSNRSKKNID